MKFNRPDSSRGLKNWLIRRVYADGVAIIFRVFSIPEFYSNTLVSTQLPLLCHLFSRCFIRFVFVPFIILLNSSIISTHHPMYPFLYTFVLPLIGSGPLNAIMFNFWVDFVIVQSFIICINFELLLLGYIFNDMYVSLFIINYYYYYAKLLGTVKKLRF